jgi:Uma2 family endonuclease
MLVYTLAMASQQTLVSPQEYLELEHKASFKSEYRDGLIVPMPGASPAHVYIKSDLHTELGICLKSQRCEVCDSDLKVRTKTKYSYPDLTVICDEPVYDDDPNGNAILLNPTLIVEVLSPSTEAYDRGDKFTAYRELKSFSEYLLISQTRPLIEQYTKQNDGSWKFLAHQGIENIFRLETINCTLTLKDIYRRVNFENSDG